MTADVRVRRASNLRKRFVPGRNWVIEDTMYGDKKWYVFPSFETAIVEADRLARRGLIDPEYLLGAQYVIEARYQPKSGWRAAFGYVDPGDYDDYEL